MYSEGLKDNFVFDSFGEAKMIVAAYDIGRSWTRSSTKCCITSRSHISQSFLSLSTHCMISISSPLYRTFPSEGKSVAGTSKNSCCALQIFQGSSPDLTNQ